MSVMTAGPPAHTLTPLPESLDFLDNSWVRIGTVAAGSAIMSTVTNLFLATVALPIYTGFNLVNKVISVISDPLSAPFEMLPNFIQVALSIGVTTLGYFTSEAFKGGVTHWKEFFHPKNWKNKLLFLGIAFGSMPFRKIFPTTQALERSILGKNIVFSFADAFIFDFGLQTLGKKVTSHIKNSTVRAVSERIQLLALPILYGTIRSIRASNGKLFQGTINGVYALCTYFPTSEQNSFVGGFSARLAHETFLSFFSQLFGTVRSAFAR